MIKTFIITVLFFSSFIYAQENLEHKIYNQQKRLQNVRSEINDYKKALATKKAEEQTTIDQLSDLDHEIDLLRKLINELQNDEQLKILKIDQTKKELEETIKSFKTLQSIFEKRLVFIYKYGKLGDLELILTSKSLNEAYIRYKYLRLIAQQDKRDIKNIFIKKSKIEQKEKQLKLELMDHQALILEKEHEKEIYLLKTQDRKRLLAKILKDKKSLKAVIQEKEMAAKFILSLITQLEEERNRLASSSGFKPREYSNFANYKGAMTWPVSGKVINQFGQRQHPKLKTITNNTGIDIQAPEGSSVRSVAAGRVSVITWMRGFGNTIILDHSKGFYTVYAHLADVFVEKGEDVHKGQIIASVGKFGVPRQSMLHFEIYGGKNLYDPEDWLDVKNKKKGSRRG